MVIARPWRFDRLRSLLADDFYEEELATQRRLEGADARIEAAQTWKQAFPDEHGTVVGAYTSGNTVAIELIWEGTQSGAMATPNGQELPPSDKRITVKSVVGRRVVAPSWAGSYIKSSNALGLGDDVTHDEPDKRNHHDHVENRHICPCGRIRLHSIPPLLRFVTLRPGRAGCQVKFAVAIHPIRMSAPGARHAGVGLAHHARQRVAGCRDRAR